MNVIDAINFLEKQTPDPSKGLPDEVFYYASSITPMVNVDLLIQDENKRTLLAWRDDPYCGTGWHIPGGIIRYRETFESRLKKVAEMEIGVDVDFEHEPIALNQLIHNERKERSHFISILYRCFLSASFEPSNEGLTPKDAGYLKWHDSCPHNLIIFHEIYRKHIG
jgi:colanic acid biosynthesis protein WcaH